MLRVILALACLASCAAAHLDGLPLPGTLIGFVGCVLTTTAIPSIRRWIASSARFESSYPRANDQNETETVQEKKRS